MRIVTAGFVLAVLWVTCCAGGHFKIFLRMAGFGDFSLGIVNALPFMANLGQIAAGMLVERTGLKKYQFVQCGSASRAMWLLVALVPLALPIPSPTAVVAVLVLMASSHLVGSLSGAAWFTWMGDLIPRRIRGRYLGNRQRYALLVRIPFVMALGAAVDAARQDGLPETFAAQPNLFYLCCGIIAVGAVLGTIDILLFLRIREVLPSHRSTPEQPLAPRPKMPRVRDVVITPMRDPAFRPVALYGACIAFAASSGGLFFWANASERLGFSYLALNLLLLAFGPIFGMLSARWWGRLIDRWGTRTALMVATTGTLLAIAHWFISTPDTPAPPLVIPAVNAVIGAFNALLAAVWPGDPPWAMGTLTAAMPVGAYLLTMLGCVAGGISWTGVELAQTNLRFSFADNATGRGRYVAASLAYMGLGGTLGGLAGGLAAWAFQPLHNHPIGPFQWNNWHAAFALSLAARLAGLGVAAGMGDPGRPPVGQFVRVMRSSIYNAVLPPLLWPVRRIGARRQRRRDEQGPYGGRGGDDDRPGRP